ncbi:MAG: peptidase C39 family protein [Candidatus Woesearchaeota archaeon]
MKPYLRTTEFTTAASSLLMVLNHFNESFELNRENEFRIWMASANLPVRASSIYGLAVFAKKNGLNPKLVMGEKEYDYPDYRFKAYTKREIDEAKFTSRLFAKECRDMDIPIEEREFDLAEVKRLVQDGHIVLLRINAGTLREKKSTSNYVVVFDYEGGYAIMDPVQGKIIVDEKLLDEAFHTLQTKKKRDPRMVVF